MQSDVSMVIACRGIKYGAMTSFPIIKNFVCNSYEQDSRARNLPLEKLLIRGGWFLEFDCVFFLVWVRFGAKAALNNRCGFASPQWCLLNTALLWFPNFDLKLWRDYERSCDNTVRVLNRKLTSFSRFISTKSNGFMLWLGLWAYWLSSIFVPLSVVFWSTMERREFRSLCEFISPWLCLDSNRW